MKIERLETHDRYLHFMKSQWETISQGASDCMIRNPNSREIQNFLPYVYIFAHPRLHDNGRDTRLLWQARLFRPKPQTNSYCFRGISHTDKLEICWLLPPREMWGQYKKGNVTESDDTSWSIWQFTHNRKALEAPHPDDWSEETIKNKLKGFKKFEMI
jgi:hypothetical protein